MLLVMRSDDDDSFIEDAEHRPARRDDPAKVPSSPKVLKLLIQSTQVHKDLEPEDFLGAIAELLFLTIVGSYIITFIDDKINPDKGYSLANNPIRNMVGYNNPCAFWDNPPALYFAAFMFCPMVFCGLRYASTDSTRAKLTKGVNSKVRCCACINCIYAVSQCIIMGIFIIRPKLPPTDHLATPGEIKEMHWFMRMHSACFLQFVPILCITMSANYFEGYMSGNPRSKPSAAGWAVLSFYICATILETVFATYAIMFYEGSYQQPLLLAAKTPNLFPNVGAANDYRNFFKVNRDFMMIIDYCWFISLPLASSFQPQAPNLVYRVHLEKSWEEFEHDGDDADFRHDDEETQVATCSAFCKVCSTMMVVWCWVVPFFVLVLWAVGSKIDGRILLAVGFGVPLLITILLWIPIKCDDHDESTYHSCCCCFSLRGASFGLCNYQAKLASFAKAAATEKFRPSYAKWFDNQAGDDGEVGVHFGGNTEMIYGWQACKERLESLGDRIERGEVQKESELALTVMNNLMWPEAGKFALGLDKDDHAFVRPYLASVFDCGENQTWTFEMICQEFGKMFAKSDVLDHNLVSRNMTDITNPAKSKTIVTQMVLKMLHKVAFGINLSSSDAMELAALQTTQLLPAVCPAMVTRTFWMWTMVAGPARDQCVKWINRYTQLILRKWPELRSAGDDKLDLLASVFLDTFTQAGGRSVPLAIDLTLGYILSRNRPASVNGVDFRQPSNIRALTVECMRFHPPVTVMPMWVPADNSDSDDFGWKHELICLDRAMADESVIAQPDEFRLDRDPNLSMAWGEFAYVGGQKDHPHSHGCPGKELSINMVIAFVLEYQKAGPWELHTDNIKFNYYGSKGFKATKLKAL